MLSTGMLLGLVVGFAAGAGAVKLGPALFGKLKSMLGGGK